MKKVIICIFAFFSILIASNYFYIRSGLYNNDIIKCGAELIYKLDSSGTNYNILYLGESSNFTFSKNDVDKRSISELTGCNNSNYKILTISKGAIHASTYNLLIKRLKNNFSIKTIILTINLRSFGVNWIESDLETNLSRANIMYLNCPPVIKKILLSFKVYDNVELFKRKERIKRFYKKEKFKLDSLDFETVRDWDAYVFDKGILDNMGKKDHEKTNIACHFIKNYAFTITENNPRIADLDEIISFCKGKKIKLIFNLLPENYQRAKALCGEDLEILMKKNVLFIKERYQRNVLFINNFNLLDDSCFIDRSWPTEHYNYFGRKSVSEKINEKLKMIITK